MLEILYAIQYHHKMYTVSYISSSYLTISSCSHVSSMVYLLSYLLMHPRARIIIGRVSIGIYHQINTPFSGSYIRISKLITKLLCKSLFGRYQHLRTFLSLLLWIIVIAASGPSTAISAVGHA